MDYVFYEKFKQLEIDVAHLKQIILDLVQETEEVPQEATQGEPEQAEKEEAEQPIPEEPEEIEARNPLEKDDEDVF